MKTKAKDLTIWITGASSGIGEALSIAFAKRGARIILSGRDKDKLEAVKSRCKNSKKHIVVPFDIADAKQAKEAYETIKAKTEKVDWLINNAGISQRALIMETTEEVERKLMEIDYFAQTRLTRLVLPDMIAQGGGKVSWYRAWQVYLAPNIAALMVLPKPLSICGQTVCVQNCITKVSRWRRYFQGLFKPISL